MGVLRLAALTLIASCYSPAARNWPAPDAAPPDAGVDARPDAALPIVPIDAAPPDAPGPIDVEITVMGPGSITLVGSGSCTKSCTLFAAYGQTATVVAEPNDKQQFAGWTSSTCMGQPATCTFTPVAPVTVSGRFEKAD